MNTNEGKNTEKNTEKNNQLDEIIVHAYDWKVRDAYDENNHMVIHAWCLDKDSKPYLLRFHDFPAFFYVELPLFVNNKYMNWTSYKAEKVYETIALKAEDSKPFNHIFQFKEKLYFYRNGKKYPMIALFFNNLNDMRNVKNKLNKPFKVQDIGIVACKVWEDSISPIRKLLTLRKINFCQWFRIKGVKVRAEDKISTIENEYVVDRKTMDGIDPTETSSWTTSPGILSIDIETYSNNNKKFPDAYCSLDVAYMVSLVYQRLGKPETRIKQIILLGDCSHTDQAEIIRVNTEIELIDSMIDQINAFDPEVITGYNILAFDYPYLDTRLKRRLREWKNGSRIKDDVTDIRSFSWGSSGYGHNEINILEMEGRISVDMLPIIRRDYKLELYNLDYVSNYFLGKGKHPVTAQEMFRIYEMFQSKADGYLDEMRRVVEYCVVDSDLVVDLFEKTYCWIGLLEMSNVMGVTPVELFTRGQQLRIQSQIYNDAFHDGIVIDHRNIPKMDYAGGFVFQPNPGLYHNVACLDFKSLYPTIMISHNICYRTFVPPEMMDKIPDEKCHIIEWDDTDGTDIGDSDEDEDFIDDDEKGTKKEVKSIHYRYKFVKDPVGIMPRLLTKLIDERDAVRKIQKNKDPNSVDWIVLEKRQLGLKTSSNSMYGGMGAQNGGKLPLPEGAACVTAKARESIQLVNKCLEDNGYKIVYGDTDSSMPALKSLDKSKLYQEAETLADELSKLFPPPMLVEPEEVYDTMLSLGKKMYLCIKLLRDGTPLKDRKKWKIRGVAPARRDNCKYKVKSYLDIAEDVMFEKDMMDTFSHIVDICIKLMSHQVTWNNLVMIKGLGSNYKNKSYPMKIFSDELAKIGKPASPGERLQYVIVKSHGESNKQLLGYKMRLPDIYSERLDSDKPEYLDYDYYLEKILMPVLEKQLWQCGYKEELDALEKKYLENDQENVLTEMKKRGYGVVIDQLLNKYQNNKSEVIEFLRTHHDLGKIVKPLISYHITRRKRIDTRVNKNPIKMMLKLIKAKREVTEYIKTLTPLNEVANKKKIKLKIVTSNESNNEPNNEKKSRLAVDWIKNKTQQLKIISTQ